MQLQKINNSLFLIILFLLPTQLGKHFWPTFAIVNGVRIDYLAPTIYVTDVLIGILFLLTFVRKPSTSNFNQPNHLTHIDQYVLSILACLLTVNLIHSANMFVTFIWITKLGECVFFGWYCYRAWSQSQLRSSILIAIAVFAGIISFV